MMLEDQHSSITSMSEEELINFIRELRKSRRIAKSAPRKTKAKAKKTPQPKQLSKDQAKELLELLGVSE